MGMPQPVVWPVLIFPTIIAFYVRGEVTLEVAVLATAKNVTRFVL